MNADHYLSLISDPVLKSSSQMVQVNCNHSLLQISLNELFMLSRFLSPVKEILV
jgi:hypothetical protein